MRLHASGQHFAQHLKGMVLEVRLTTVVAGEWVRAFHRPIDVIDHVIIESGPISRLEMLE